MGYIPWFKKRFKKKTKEKSIAMLSYKSGSLYAQIEKNSIPCVYSCQLHAMRHKL
jgi:hypothetical protein